MMQKLMLTAVLCAAMATTTANAEMSLLGVGTITGHADNPSADLSGLKATLENGAPANYMQGVGSGLAYAGGNMFLALPDRGPNAVAYNAAVDNSTSFIPRFHSLEITLQPALPGSTLPFIVTPRLKATTLLYSNKPLAYGNGQAAGLGNSVPTENAAGRFYFSGRSDNFVQGKPSSFAGHARLDPEGIRLSRDGRTVFISDEYGPYLSQFDRRSGRRLKSIALPEKLAAPNLSSVGDTEIAQNTTGRTANKGMEGLAITPDGKTLVGVMQAAIRQDAALPATKKLLRIVAVDIASGRTREYGYQLTDGSGVSEILAINNHEFLLLERDGGGLGEQKPAVTKKLFRIDLTAATEIGKLSGAEAAAAAVPKSEVLDMVKLLQAQGVTPDRIPGKLEGIAFGPDVTVNGTRMHALYMVNDNDFLPQNAGANLVYVIGFTDQDLPGLDLPASKSKP